MTEDGEKYMYIFIRDSARFSINLLLFVVTEAEDT